MYRTSEPGLGANEIAPAHAGPGCKSSVLRPFQPTNTPNKEIMK
jgi:hypothetical protein